MNQDNYIEQFRDLGVDMDSKQWQRRIRILRTMFSLQNDTTRPLKFGEIYKELKKQYPDTITSKSILHRDLKILKEYKGVRPDNPSATKKKYIANASTIADALELLQEKTIEKLEKEQKMIAEKIDRVKKIDCVQLTETVIRNMTNKQDTVSNRFGKGVAEMHRLLLNNIIRPARKGDIIRVTAMFATTLLSGAIKRSMKFIKGAKKGAEIRYLVTIDLFKQLENDSHDLTVKELSGILKAIKEINLNGPGKFLVRATDAPKTYNHVSLNNERVALILTESPITTTVFTREFNADLVDNIIDVFEILWKTATPLDQLIASKTTAYQLSENNPIVTATLQEQQCKRTE